MKSLEVKFSEAMNALKKAGRAKKFEEIAKALPQGASIEVKLNAAESVLKDAGVVREVASIRKHNGASENFVEGSPFNGDRTNNFSPGYTKEVKDPCAKGDKVLFDGLLKAGKITEAEHRKMTGNKPEGYEKLTEQQRRDFDFARMVGINESDAFKLTKISGTTFKEVSR